MVMNDSAARPRSSTIMSNSSPPAPEAADASPGVPSAEETGEDSPLLFIAVVQVFAPLPIWLPTFEPRLSSLPNLSEGQSVGDMRDAQFLVPRYRQFCGTQH